MNNKLSKSENENRKLRKLRYMTIFINGKQKRVKRPETINGIPMDEFIQNNGDNMFYYQNGDYEMIKPENDLYKI
jgi:hypothetical protein